GPDTRMAITAGRRPARRDPCYGTRATVHIGGWDPAPALSGQDGDRAHRLVEQVQCVRRVVHVVDAVGVERHGQAEQGPGTGRRAARVVEQEFGYLLARRGGLDDEAIPAVDGEHVTLAGDR